MGDAGVSVCVCVCVCVVHGVSGGGGGLLLAYPARTPVVHHAGLRFFGHAALCTLRCDSGEWAVTGRAHTHCHRGTHALAGRGRGTRRRVLHGRHKGYRGGRDDG